MNNDHIEKHEEQKYDNGNHPTNIVDHNNSIESSESEQITKSYFCFECGAIMTTKEDKKQHELIELGKKKTNQLEDNY
jgi:hypothetical protein